MHGVNLQGKNYKNIKEGNMFVLSKNLNLSKIIPIVSIVVFVENLFAQTKSDSTLKKISDENILYTNSVNQSTLTDIDGNVYKTIKIGNQIWMAENLKVTHYRNGDAIPNLPDNSSWADLSTGAYCAYNNSNDSVATYGLLYNWHAIDDRRNIAPAGWHVPTDEEWKQLEKYLGMSSSDANDLSWRGSDEGDGGKMKERGTTHWKSPNKGATNTSGFTALPGGYRYDGTFIGIGYCGSWWSATTSNSIDAWTRYLDCDYSGVSRNSSIKQRSFSVRLVKD